MDMEMEAKVKAYMEENGVDREAAMKACGYKDTMKEDSTEELDALKADIATLKAENEFLRKGFIEEGYIIRADSIEKKPLWNISNLKVSKSTKLTFLRQSSRLLKLLRLPRKSMNWKRLTWP